MQQKKYPGKFIVFDSLDGSGQSTQAMRLFDFFNNPKQKHRFAHTGVHLTKEPTSGLIGGLIRGQLSHDWKSNPECLQLLFAADRAHHLEKEIIPLLERGVIVVCDRYFFSSFAYGSLGIKDPNWLFQINKNFLLPDLTFFLKVSPKICLERIKTARHHLTLFEQEQTLSKVWENYKKLTKKFKNIYIIDAERPVDAIAKDVIRVVENKLR